MYINNDVNHDNGFSRRKASENLLRVFVALEMPPEVIVEIERIENMLKTLRLFLGSYVQPSLAHITLQFIGYVEPAALIPIKKILRGVRFSPLEARLSKLGFFAEQGIPRVVWLDVISLNIIELAHKIERGMLLDSHKKNRLFQPHITIARVKYPIDDIEEFESALQAIAVKPIPFTINEFVLKQSTLTPSGPVYVDLERYKVRG